MDLLDAADSELLSLIKQILSNDQKLLYTMRYKDSGNHAFNVDDSSIHYACRKSLHYGYYNRHLNIVKLLLKDNVDVNMRESILSETLSQCAMYREFEDIVRLLIENQACDSSWKERDFGKIALKGYPPVF
jgi:hypothetical protein